MFTKVKKTLIIFIKLRVFKLYLNYIAEKISVTSAPFISGDTFRNFCKFILDEKKSFNPKKVTPDSFIFVKTDYLNEFFSKYYDQINCNFILLSSNSNIVVDEKLINKFKKNNLMWFMSNLNANVDDLNNIGVLPNGFINRKYLKNGKINNLKNFTKLDLNEKVNKIFTTTNVLKNLDRINLVKASYKNKLTGFHRYVEHKEFLKIISKYKFVACPASSQLDTTLIWETLFVNSIPILIEDNFSNNLKKIGIPVLCINNWDELKDFSEMQLQNIYFELTKNIVPSNFCYFNFWLDYILKKQTQ